MPFFSIVIPTFNRGHMVADAIESALSQSFTDHEIIVVDDGSNDDTAQVVKRYGKQVQYHRLENAGVASARNAGWALSEGDFVCSRGCDGLSARHTLVV